MKKIILFCLVSSLVVLQAKAQQIFYYDINDVRLQPTHSQLIQIDSPITAVITSSQAGLNITVDNNGVTLNSLNTNVEVKMSGSMPDAMSINQIIKPTDSWQVPTNMVLSDGGSSGQWQNADGMFLGVRIKESGLWYYGWIRMDVKDTGNSFSATIYDYACNMEQGDSIYAGEISGLAVKGVTQNHSIKPICINKQLSLVGITPGKNYDLYITDISGRNVTHLNYIGTTIDLSGYKSGIYILLVEGADTRQKFKILL